METTMQTAVAYGQSKEIGVYALASVVNALAAEGVSEPTVQVRIMIPPYAYKSRMHTMEKIMKKCCEGRGIALQDIKSERNTMISQSMVIVTGSGHKVWKIVSQEKILFLPSGLGWKECFEFWKKKRQS